jgi:hypothetical protein
MSTVRITSLSRATRLSVFGLIFLVSCNTDDESINPLLGTWILKATTAQNCKDPSQNVTITFACDDSTCNKYIFNEDGTLNVEQFKSSKFTTIEGTYTISNTTVITNVTEAQNSTTRTFTFDVSEPNNLYLKEIFPYGSGKCSPTTVMMR